MSGPNEFNKLTCSCGGEEFAEVSNIMWKEGGGVVKKPVGYDCTKCRRRMSTDAAISRAKQKHLEAQMEELKAQQKLNDESIQRDKPNATNVSNKVA